MMSYEENKQTVYELFMKACLKNVSEEEKKKHLQENEDVIRNAYDDAVFFFTNEDPDLLDVDAFTDYRILGDIVSNLDMLY